jgi:uncharacterized protein (DUF2267 family)
MDLGSFVDRLYAKQAFTAGSEACRTMALIRAARATLDTLAECLSDDTARRVAEYLPLTLTTEFRRADRRRGEALTCEEFFARVAKREGVSPSRAPAHAGMTLAALQEVLPPPVLEEVRACLPTCLSAHWAEPPLMKKSDPRQPDPPIPTAG